MVCLWHDEVKHVQQLLHAVAAVLACAVHAELGDAHLHIQPGQPGSSLMAGTNHIRLQLCILQAHKLG